MNLNLSIDEYSDDNTDECTIFYCFCEKNTSLLKSIIETMSQVSSVENIENNTKKNIKQLYMKISKDSGIEMFSDSEKMVTACTTITKNFFKIYEFSDEDPLCIGISLDILKSCFKYIHKVDELEIRITKDPYNNFPDTIAFILNKTKGFKIKFNIIQNIDNESDNEYNHAMYVDSQRFSNLYREMGGVKRDVKITIIKDVIHLTSSIMDIAHNWVQFKIEDPTIYNFQNTTVDKFLKSDHFKIASKLSNFDVNVEILINRDLGVMVKTNIVNTKESKEILGFMTMIISSYSE